MEYTETMTVEGCWLAYKAEHLPQIIDKRRQESAWKNLRVLGPTDLNDLSPDVIRRYVKSRGSGATAKRELAVLRAAIRHAVKTGRISGAPIIWADIKETPRSKWLTVDELKILISAGDAHGIGDFVRLMALTGQRPGAVLGLKWSQVDDRSEIINFNRGVARAKHAGIVPVAGPLAQLISALRATTGGRGYVLWGARLHDIRRRWASTVKTAGMEWVTPHTIRHSVATNLVKQGVPLAEVSKLLGHTSTTTTEKIYVKYSPDYLTNATGHLGNNFGD